MGKRILQRPSIHLPPTHDREDRFCDGLKESFNMVRLRLRRVGAKRQPSYRIIAAEKEAPRDGAFKEILGFYNPRTEPATIELVEDRIYDWMSKGAQPSESVARIFQSAGLTQRFERFKKGEPVETLVSEAAAAQAARVVSVKTRSDSPHKTSKAKA
jgi:small subunit ribosomal protein S16